MSRGALVRFILVLGLLAGCAALALNQEPRLGLDLSGGTQITLETSDSPSGVEANAENTEKAARVIEGRVNALGVAESTVVRSGDNRILVELPDVQDPDQAVETIGRTAQLTVHPVIQGGLSEGAKPSKKDNLIMATEQGDVLELGPAKLEGNDITGAEAAQPENGVGWVTNVDFSGQGSDAFDKLSAEAACATGDQRRIAIVLDGEVISSPEVQVACGGSIVGSTQISGDFNAEEAKNLAILIEGGALPLPVEVIERRTVGPTLGDAAIEASWKAGIIGLVLTGLFIILVYRFVGFLATLALTSYALLAYALLLGVDATLTLPGLAGFVLAIGMAIDANVLVFERAREEYERAPSAGLRRALMVGFNKAWSAIIDSNVTTLLAAALLFFLGSGPIKGFGVTLSIGVVASMVSALIIARVLTELGVGNRWVSHHPRFTGIGDIGRVRKWLDAKNPNLMIRRKLWMIVSGVAMALAVAGIAIQTLNLGVEFTGGRVLEYSTEQQVDVDEAREAVGEAGFTTATVQKTDDDWISVRTGEITEDEAASIEAAIAEVGGGATQERDEEIGASFGNELRNKALIAFGVAFLVQLAYLAFRFKWTFGVAAVAAMFHDVIIVVGLFAWLGKPIDGIFLAAAMTIIGLSVNDTVVVFDRIRERWRESEPGADFKDEANRAAIETLPRTVNTGLGTMFILAALALLGGDSLRDFAIALLVGLIVGTYSSVFTATPLLTYMQEKWPMSKETRQRVERAPDDSGAVV